MNSFYIANVYCFGRQHKTFVYKILEKDKNAAGSLVKVKFGKNELFGVILSVDCISINKDEFITIDDDIVKLEKIKEIQQIVIYNFLQNKFLDFLKKMAWYNIIAVERLIDIVVLHSWLNKKQSLKSIEELNKKEAKKKAKNINKINIIQLNVEQENIAKYIKIDSFRVSLIRGVMGSGKTYIFLEIVRKKIFENKENQILIMVPEIALTRNFIDIIYSFTGIEPIIWHSSVSLSKKKIYYENIINGKIRIILSTRSGLLLPYKKLSLIVIDEEHDISYKQNEIPCYNARDMAILRAQYEDIPVILSSATPSIETIKNVIEKKYDIYTINKKYFNSSLPNVHLI